MTTQDPAAERAVLGAVLLDAYPIRDMETWAADAREKLDGRPLVVSVSGGKDSTAMCLLFLEAGLPFRAVHMDTGWEHPDTDRYVREYLPAALGVEIEIIGRPGGMEQLIREKGAFPSRVSRFCTQELKVYPFLAWLREQDDEVVSAVGIRRAESKSRSRALEWEQSPDFDCEVWRPLVDWSVDDVVAIHQAHDLVPNPLYLRGASRVGCYPCIFARKDEIRSIAENSPARIDHIRGMEASVGAEAEAREQLRFDRAVEAMGRPGVTVDEVIDTTRNGHHRKAAWKTLGRAWAVRVGLIADWREWWNPPAWFQNPSTHHEDDMKGACWPIDKVVSWSRTSWGGRQVELFAPPARRMAA